MEVKKLDATQTQNVSYCIPIWLRNTQIKAAITRVAGRVEPGEERSEPIAVVNFGPSLNDTWEELKNFKYIMSCSGAHKFLVEHGIIPTWHVEVDPREHKVGLIGPPHPDVEYIIASACHPKVFDHLKDNNVKLWHVFDPTDEGWRLLPHGEWAITGGCSVGLRTLTMAAFFGFRDIHVFGMDGSAKDGASHTLAHPNAPPKYSEVEYGGKTYQTTPAMLEAARQTWHELDQLAKCTFKFYGEGLVQAMAKDYVRKHSPAKNTISFRRPEVISDEYRKLNEKLHEDNLFYGVGGAKHSKAVLKLSQALKTTSILDYGCIPYSGVVTTEHGPMRIKDVVDTRYDGKVLSLQNGKLVWNSIVGWSVKSNTGKRWVSLGVDRPKKQLTCTEDHECAYISDPLSPSVEFQPALLMAGYYAVRNISLGPNQFRENALYNEDQIQALMGMVLGDGYVDKMGRYYGAQGEPQREYAEFKSTLLGGRISSSKASGKGKNPTLLMHCPTNAQTKLLRSMLYPNGHKIVPAELLSRMDERALALWYGDDGRLKMIHGRPYVNLHTEGFSDADRALLVDWFASRWGLTATPYSIAEGQALLHFSATSSERFLTLVAKFLPPSMYYKLPVGMEVTERYEWSPVSLGYSAIKVNRVVERPQVASKLYDITVESAHNFVCNNTVVHNCGKGMLAQELPFPIWEYDPAVPGKTESPRPADIVVCTDVLEHIEPDMLGAVLGDLSRCTLKIGYFVIHTGPSTKSLADGRNAHLIQRNMTWWQKQLKKYFTVGNIQKNGPLVTAIVAPKPKVKAKPV
jgi:uncharacterized Rossmann fold enzyme